MSPRLHRRRDRRPRNGYSLRRRLYVRLFGALAGLTAALFVFVDAYAGRAADSAYDRLLLASALSIADTLRQQDGRITADLPYSAFGILAMARRDRVFYRIAAPDGAVITGYPDLPVPPGKGDPAEPRFADAAYRDEPVRVAVLHRFIAPTGGSGWVTIAVAQTRLERDAMAADLLVKSFLPIVLAALAGAALIRLGVRQALAPLGALEHQLLHRSAHDLSPIVQPPPAEVAQLVTAINQMMARLKASLDAMQMFLADAAHQIRTPLATLRLLAEAAADEDDPAALRRIAGRIHRNAVEASQLTSQLLSHAMVLHRAEALERERLDLAALVRQVVQRAAAVADDDAIRLTTPDNAFITGDAISLREALANLLDNALKYGGSRGVVDVTLTGGNGGVAVDIADHGPGIADADKPVVLQRFRRGPETAGVGGSGLGLAIATAAVTAQGGTLTLLDRPGGGLVVRLAFPPTVPPPAGTSPVPTLLPLLALLACLAAGDAWAGGTTTLYPAPAGEGRRLRLHTATDRHAMEPLVRDFQSRRPDVAVESVDMDTAELYADVLDEDGTAADLLISSAADLQVKLVNDGHTRAYVSPATRALPDWANWRNEAFGFTFEPAAIVYNPALVPAAQVPHTRDDLIRLLRERPETYRRRIATYDIAVSGIGYLFATHDSVLSSQFWPLMAAMGNAGVRLADSTADVLDLVERGEVLIAYNVLGSYALARARAGAAIGIVLPEDYTQVTARVAVIPRTARNPDLAGIFIDYLLSEDGQRTLSQQASLHAISPLATGDASAAALRAGAAGSLLPITLGPALLVFQDQMKRDRFLQQWLPTVQMP